MASMQQPMKPDQSQAQAEARTEEWVEPRKEITHMGRHQAAAAKTEEMMQSGKATTNMTRVELADATQSTHEVMQEASSFLQQTGEQMMNMAQGAVDTVKNTLGMNMPDKNN